jgi:uroporphyrinogen decarboxylase
MGKRIDRLVTALEHGAPVDCVPLWELHFHLWNKFSDGTFVSGSEYMKLGAGERERVLKNDARIIIEVADAIGFSGITIPDAPWDCEYILPPEDRLKLARYISGESPDFTVAAGCAGVISMPDSTNYLKFCYRLMDEPETIDEICHTALQNGMDMLKQFADCGIRVAYAAADMADNHGQFFSDAQMDRFILPYLTRWAEEAKRQGIYPVLHTDGNITRLIDRLADTGICAVQAIDPVAGMDIRAIKARMGNRLCLNGNLDCGELILASPEKIYGNTRDLVLDCKQGGCFVLGASNAVVIDTPKENYEAVIAAWRDYGSYR